MWLALMIGSVYTLLNHVEDICPYQSRHTIHILMFLYQDRLRIKPALSGSRLKMGQKGALQTPRPTDAASETWRSLRKSSDEADFS
jgi:hypothetical protein